MLVEIFFKGIGRRMVRCDLHRLNFVIVVIAYHERFCDGQQRTHLTFQGCKLSRD
uniref:Uncharacterized protein n=1 Tax=Rhizophora mucronata TaxID=61149 RepID=A0A2P2ISU0_RHIMU